MAEPLLPPEVVGPQEVAPPGSVEGLRGWLGVVRELVFAMVAGFFRMAVFNDNVELYNHREPIAHTVDFTLVHYP